MVMVVAAEHSNTVIKRYLLIWIRIERDSTRIDMKARLQSSLDAGHAIDDDDLVGFYFT